MSVRKLRQIPADPVEVGTRASRQVLIGPDEGPHFAMRRFVLEAGGAMPPHTNRVEHEQFVLGGRAEVGIGDQVFEVERGDVVFIPAGVPHWYRTTGDAPFEFLCVVPNAPDEVQLA